MTLASSQVRVAGTGELSLAPLGTALPTKASTALSTAYVGYGYTTEDGVVLSKTVTREGIPAWQATTPVRYLITEQEFTIQATFLQANDDVVRLWLGAAAFAGTTPDWAANIPIDPITQQFVLVLDWVDGGIHTRLAVPKCEITETGDVTVARQALTFPITFGALVPDTGTSLATYMTDDPAFNPSTLLAADQLAARA